jgi:uncharacterized protein (TIGR03067 family)
MRGKILCIVAITVLVAAGTSPGGGGKDPGEAVLKKIQGKWQFIAHEMNGKPATPEELKMMTITFTGNKWAVSSGEKVVQAGTHKFDPTKKPGHVDAIVTEGEDKGNKMLGIYEMKGDKMKVCFDPKGKERPKSFKAGEGQMSATVERIKKKP